MSILKVSLGVAAAGTAGIAGTYTINKFFLKDDDSEKTESTDREKGNSGQDTRSDIQTTEGPKVVSSNEGNQKLSEGGDSAPQTSDQKGQEQATSV